MRRLHTHSLWRSFDFSRISGSDIDGTPTAKNPTFGCSEARVSAGDGHAGFETESAKLKGRKMYMCKGPKGHIRNDSAGFTSLELLACITSCALLLAVIVPILATSRSRSDRVACLSNLRQIGNAFRQFGLEHNDIMPWRQQAGPDGNFNQAGKHELWFQYWWLRESIGTPKILMDPAETRPARIATNWNLDVNGGLQFFKNSAVAYALGVDSSTDLPRSMLVADRNILTVGFGGCSTSLSTAAQVFVSGTSAARWLDDVHRTFGNVALADGSVESVDSEGLRRIIAESRDVGNAVHIMIGNNW